MTEYSVIKNKLEQYQGWFYKEENIMRKILGLFFAFAIVMALSSCMVASGSDMDPVSAGTVSVESVSLDKKTLSLTVGASEYVVGTVSPDDATEKAVTYSSSDESVATVSQDGKVTAVKVGIAIITVTTVDGSKIDKCDVTVSSASSVLVTGVTLNKTTLSLAVGGTETILASVAPDNATNKSVVWASDNTGVATVDEAGKVKAVKVGTAKISATTVDGAKTGYCDVTVTAATTVIADTKVISETGYMIDFAGNATGKTVDKLTLSDKSSFKRFWLVKDGKDYIVDKDGKIVDAGNKVMTGMWLTESGKDVGWAVFVENTSPTSNDGWYVSKW